MYNNISVVMLKRWFIEFVKVTAMLITYYVENLFEVKN